MYDTILMQLFYIADDEPESHTAVVAQVSDPADPPLHQTHAALVKRLQQQARDALAMCQSAVYLTSNTTALQYVKQQAQQMYQALQESASELSPEGLHYFPLLNKAVKKESRDQQKKLHRAVPGDRRQKEPMIDPLLDAKVPS